MPSQSSSRKPQVNVELDFAEMDALKAICAKEHIKSPSTMAGIWIREVLKGHDDDRVLIGAVKEAQARGVDVLRVLAKACRSKS